MKGETQWQGIMSLILAGVIAGVINATFYALVMNPLVAA